MVDAEPRAYYTQQQRAGEYDSHHPNNNGDADEFLNEYVLLTSPIDTTEQQGDRYHGSGETDSEATAEEGSLDESPRGSH